MLLSINNNGGKLAPSRWATFGGFDNCPIVQKIENGPAYALNGPFDCDRDFVPRCPACSAAPNQLQNGFDKRLPFRGCGLASSCSRMLPIVIKQIQLLGCRVLSFLYPE